MLLYWSTEEKKKKLYKIMLILILVSIPIGQYNMNILDFRNDSNFSKITLTFGSILVIIPFFIYKQCSKNGINPKVKGIKLFSQKDYVIFFLIIIIRIIQRLFEIIKYKKINSEIFNVLNTTLILFFLSLLMKFISYFQFYKHNIFSLILIFIFGILFDIITFDLSDKNYSVEP